MPFDPYGRTVEFATIAGIAEAIRDELGEEIDAHPGYRDPAEAGQVNRAYRAATRRILRAIATPYEDLAALLTWALDRVARLRLAAGGLDERTIAFLLGLEPGNRDDWPTYLVLADWSGIRRLLAAEGPDRDLFGPAPPTT